MWRTPAEQKIYMSAITNYILDNPKLSNKKAKIGTYVLWDKHKNYLLKKLNRDLIYYIKKHPQNTDIHKLINEIINRLS
jgi:hypothetical protein